MAFSIWNNITIVQRNQNFNLTEGSNNPSGGIFGIYLQELSYILLTLVDITLVKGYYYSNIDLKSYPSLAIEVSTMCSNHKYHKNLSNQEKK